MKQRWWQPRYFVTTIIIAAAMVMGVRIEAVRDTLVSGKAFSPIESATAEDTAAKASDLAPKPAAQAPEHPAKAAKEETKVVPPSAIDTHKDAPAEAKDNAAKTAESSPEHREAAAPAVDIPSIATPAPEEMSEGEIEVLKQLSSRRAALDRREQDMAQKSALLQAAEIRVDKKVKQMEGLRAQLQGMLTQLDEQQQAQITNLVKIYETMKPKDAARILQTLEMPVLLGVMQQMKPARSAPILAEMDALKAKDITLTLAKQHELPSVNVVKQ